jgi:tight adherence protein B
MTGLLLSSALVALAVMIVFVAVWRSVRTQDPVEARLEEYGVAEHDMLSADAGAETAGGRQRYRATNRILTGFGLADKFSAALTSADLPLTAAELALIMVGAGLIGLFVGTMRLGLGLGLLVAVVCAYLPMVYVRYKQNQRRRALTGQIPDVLTLLVGALRAGYGLAQAMEMLEEQLPPPASVEFGRVLRGISLGLSLQQALADMAERVGSDDLDLVVTAMNVQYEMGGNLAQTLETIGETVRDRIRILREIQVMTAQQRFTGYMLAVLPIALAFILMMINPEYMSRLFEPGMMRLLPITAGVMQFLGYLVIRRIVNIEV